MIKIKKKMYIEKCQTKILHNALRLLEIDIEDVHPTKEIINNVETGNFYIDYIEQIERIMNLYLEILYISFNYKNKGENNTNKLIKELFNK